MIVHVHVHGLSSIRSTQLLSCNSWCSWRKKMRHECLYDYLGHQQRGRTPCTCACSCTYGESLDTWTRRLNSSYIPMIVMHWLHRWPCLLQYITGIQTFGRWNKNGHVPTRSLSNNILHNLINSRNQLETSVALFEKHRWPFVPWRSVRQSALVQYTRVRLSG